MENPLISADEISEEVEGDDTMTNGEGRQQVFAEPGDGDGMSTHPKPMSKKAMKKAAKAERIAATKLERRAREKEARKEKKRVLAEKRAAGELDEDDEEETRRRAKRAKIDFAGKVVVDLGFDVLMSDKEIKSLCSQLSYTHSANRQASHPFTLFFTSLGGRTYERLQTLSDASYRRWSNTHWYPESYESLWSSDSDSTTSVEAPSSPSKTDANLSGGIDFNQNTNPTSTAGASPMNPQLPKSSFVYLTADTEDELQEIKADEIYIIGGICDHNRYKNLCLDKAVKSGIRTARLPIGRYLASLPTRKVLTVNQVFEILIKWVESKDWEQALYSVIPKRKFQQGEKEATVQIVDASAVEDCPEAEGSL